MSRAAVEDDRVRLVSVWNVLIFYYSFFFEILNQILVNHIFVDIWTELH